MDGTCQCGMSREQRGSATTCHECGASTCRTCAIEVDINRYCRWCATSVAYTGAPAGV